MTSKSQKAQHYGPQNPGDHKFRTKFRMLQSIHPKHDFLTYYVMPSNILLSRSIGLGNFTVIDNDQKNSVSSDRGFSLQLKAGKEWWISKRWGMGVALTYRKTAVTNMPGGGVKEMMNSNNIGILLSASLH